MTEKVLALVFLVGCAYETDFADCTIQCSAEIGCPNDLTCGAEGFCRTAGTAATCAEENGAPPSCANLPKTCGPRSDEDCCAAGTQIPGGSFFRGYDVASDATYASMNSPATISPFQLDRFEVTVGRFRKFLEAGMGTQANTLVDDAAARSLNGMIAQGGWDPSWNASLAANANALRAALKCDDAQAWTDTPGTNENLPINCVTWFEAFAFCAWDGGFLPTETEWNFAAAGGSEQRAYPWSSPAGTTAIDCSYANYNNASTYCIEPPDGAVAQVGSAALKGAGKYGQADLAGNVFEWALDGFGPLDGSCSDCANLNETSRVLRGGGWDNQAADVRTNYRLARPPTLRHRAVGIRCAKAAL